MHDSTDSKHESKTTTTTTNLDTSVTKNIIEEGEDTSSGAGGTTGWGNVTDELDDNTHSHQQEEEEEEEGDPMQVDGDADYNNTNSNVNALQTQEHIKDDDGDAIMKNNSTHDNNYRGDMNNDDYEEGENQMEEDDSTFQPETKRSQHSRLHDTEASHDKVDLQGRQGPLDESKDYRASSVEHENIVEEKKMEASEMAETQKGSKSKLSISSHQPLGSSQAAVGSNGAGAAANGARSSGVATATSSAVVSTAAPPPPIMKGTLSYDLDQRRHLIRGMWNYENSNTFPPQRFELSRTLEKTEDVKVLPCDGEFHGSFSLAYVHTTSKGKQKERSKVITESGVKIKFTPIDGTDGEYHVDGTGTNQFGVFHINGTATPQRALEGDPTLNVVLRKRYEPSESPVVSTVTVAGSSTTDQVSATVVAAPLPAPVSHSKNSDGGNNRLAELVTSSAVMEPEVGPLPDPSESFPVGVVALQGKLKKSEVKDLGLAEVIHKITGLWSPSLEFILTDPENSRQMCNKFEYEHKSSVPSHTFPVTGRYSGWFDLTNEDGTRTRINERDVYLKFRKNNAGYYNVDGKGSNVFGKYTISGTFRLDNETITIFRHFQPRKIKAGKAAAATPAAVAPAGAATVPKRPSILSQVEPKLKLEDAKIPGDCDSKEPLKPIEPPAHTTYSAVSRGVLRVNDDGSHSCQGKWAVTREHFNSNQTSNFNFRLEAHFAAEATIAMQKESNEDRVFPLDSAMYKGSFQLKKQQSRYQTVVDLQIVMRFRLNTQGSYNVYGRGINAIGEFILMGTMIMSGKTGGQVELYRMYPPELLAAPVPPQPPKPAVTASTPAVPVKVVEAPPPPPVAVVAPTPAPAAVEMFLAPIPNLGQRRESARTSKLPSRLEDDDPSAVLTRSMEKCAQILRVIREKDVELGAFFSEPVDPVALSIPHYYQIIKEPMDLKTIHRRMEAGEVKTPEEFARLVRLVFENAVTFNVDPAHSVHQAARNLLVLFNQKYRDVDRMVQNLRRTQGDDGEKSKKGKVKEEKDKKRKRVSEEPKSLKRQRMEEAQAMAASNAASLAAIVAAAPPTSTSGVTRAEFSLMLNLLQQLQQQVVQTHTALAELSPGDEIETPEVTTAPPPVTVAAPVPAAPTPAPERKPVKRKSEPLVVETPVPPPDDSLPLTLEEQEFLTDTINDLPQEHLGGVIQIIREAAPVGADEEEIDLEIDQLDTKTQRKLLRHVSKFVKKSKAKGKKKVPAKPGPTGVSKKGDDAKASAPVGTNKKAAKTAPKAKPTPLFAIANKGDSDSESEEGEITKSANHPLGGKVFTRESVNEFKLGDGLADLHDDDDNDDELGSSAIAASWRMMSSEAASGSGKKKDGGLLDEDDAWGAAREQAAAAKVREAERKAREEKLKAEAEQAKNQRLADAAAQSEKLRAQRLEEEANEARMREQQEREAEEARRAAREAARAQVQSIEQTVDLDAQRDIMKQYEQSFLDKDLGGGSPSSDFGF